MKLALLFSMSTKIPHHDNIYQDTYRFKSELITYKFFCTSRFTGKEKRFRSNVL